MTAHVLSIVKYMGLNAVVGLFRKGDRSQGEQTIRRRDRKKKKVYSDSDGEYVDFEEVKKK